MAGLVGSWSLQGSRNAVERAEKLAAHLSCGASRWISRSASLCIGETDPLDGSADLLPSEGVSLAADITLYDRAALALALGAAGEATRLSDPELVVRAFRRWGPECFGKLNGDFAIALYDWQARRLYLVRDHSGLRPLHYRHDARGIDFCSMPRPLA